MSPSALFEKWLTPGIGIKRWLGLMALGIFTMALCLAFGLIKIFGTTVVFTSVGWLEIALGEALGIALVLLAAYQLSRTLLLPYRRHQQGHLIDIMVAHSRRYKGVRVVAIGGGTGLPAVLRAMKATTSNITAVVTVADDGGSSGRLRRDLGVLPPGDLRNNIAALADDENLMTQLFQYRFPQGELRDHAFGNLFISALAGVTGSLEAALIETERVLNIQGRVLPATLDDVTLSASIRLPNGRVTIVQGESQIPESGGVIEQIDIAPANAQAYHESVQAILDADVVVIGPGSLYTSIIPNLLIDGIREAVRTTRAHKLYVCNIATQAGETDGYTVADHILALERIIGRGVLETVLANSAYPGENAGVNTHYVAPAPEAHEIHQRYHIRCIDLVDADRPWRHDPHKLARAILETSSAPSPAVARPLGEIAPL